MKKNNIMYMVVLLSCLFINTNVYAADDIPVCENPEVLKVIFFGSIIVDIVKIVIPIGLIIMAMIDFSKGVTSNNDGDNKKNLSKLIKRFVYAVLIFAVPWIVKIVIISLGDLTDDVNFTDCLKNATSEEISVLEAKYNSTTDETTNNGGGGGGGSSNGPGGGTHYAPHKPMDFSEFGNAAVIENLAAYAGSEMGYYKDEFWTGLLFQCAVFMNNYNYQKALSGVDINTPITTESMCKVFSIKFSGGYYLFTPKYCNFTFTDLANSRNGGREISDHYKELMLKAAEAVLTREFTIPKNVISARGSDNNANDTGVIYDSSSVGGDQKFSTLYSNKTAFENTDIYGNKVSTDPDWYINRANELYKEYFG